MSSVLGGTHGGRIGSKISLSLRKGALKFHVCAKTEVVRRPPSMCTTARSSSPALPISSSRLRAYGLGRGASIFGLGVFNVFPLGSIVFALMFPPHRGGNTGKVGAYLPPRCGRLLTHLLCRCRHPPEPRILCCS